MSTLQEIRNAIKSSGQIDKLVELILSDIKIAKFNSEIKKEIQKCSNLEILVLSNCGLQSLDNMPDCDLTAIDLTNNKLGDSELVKLTNYKNLGQLILNENKITKLDSIKVLSKLQNLQQVDFSDNPMASQQNYKEFVFENLPKLEILDRFDREGNEQVEEEQFQDDQDDEDGQQLDDDQDEDEEDFDQDEEQQSPKPKKKR